MTNIPENGAGGFVPSVLPNGFQTTQANPNDFGAQVGQANMASAQMVGQGANDFGAHTIHMQDLANEAAATAADSLASNRVNDYLYNPRTGLLAKQGADAVDAWGERGLGVQSDLSSIYSAVRGTLTNPEAQRQFDQRWIRTQSYAMSTAASHVGQQNRVYLGAVQQANVEAQINTAALNWNNPDAFGMALENITSATLKQAQTQGFGDSPDVVNQLYRQNFDKAWTARIKTMASTDPQGAQSLLDKVAESNVKFTMTGPDGQPVQVQARPPSGVTAAQLQQFVAPQVRAVQAKNLATSIMAGQPGGDSTTDNNPGNLRAGPDSFQTFASPEDGVVATANNLRVYPAKYGADTLNAIAAKWAPRGDGNNDPSTWAANVGKIAGIDPDAKLDMNDPTLLTALIPAIARQEKGPDKAKAFDPATVQIGVDRAFGGEHVAGGPSTAPTSDRPTAHLSDWLAQADAATDHDPILRDQVRSEIMTRTNQIDAGINQNNRAARDTLLVAALGNQPGAPKPTDLDGLLNTPQARQAWADAQPETQRGILTILDQNAKQTDVPMTDAAVSRWHEIQGLRAEDPDAFMGLNPVSPDNAVLPLNLKLQLANQQATMDRRSTADQSKQIRWNSALSTVRDITDAANLDRSSANDDGKKSWNTFAGAFQGAIDQYQQDNGKLPGNTDLRNIASDLVAPVHIKTPWYRPDETVRAFAVPAGTDPQSVYRDIPDADRVSLVNAWTAKHGSPPSEAQLQGLYQTLTATKRTANK